VRGGYTSMMMLGFFLKHSGCWFCSPEYCMLVCSPDYCRCWFALPTAADARLPPKIQRPRYLLQKVWFALPNGDDAGVFSLTVDAVYFRK
jgi:hypothetical protein